jgi:hypothetical protein
LSSNPCTAKISKEFKQLNSKKTNNQFKNWAKDPNRSFPKEGMQTDNRYIKMFNDQGNANETHN